MFKLNGKPVSILQDLIIGEGEDAITIPAGSLQDQATREQYGIVEVPDDPRPDDRYYFVTQNTDGSYSAEPKPIDELKAWRSAEIKETASAILQPTDWLVVRSYETGDPLPDNTRAYRAAVRAVSNAAEAAIAACTTVEELAALQTVWPEAQA